MTREIKLELAAATALELLQELGRQADSDGADMIDTVCQELEAALEN